jgi:hypothetical protein
VRLKKTPIDVLRASHLNGAVCQRSDQPRSEVAEYVTRYVRMEPHQLEEIAHAWLSGWDEAEKSPPNLRLCWR